MWEQSSWEAGLQALESQGVLSVSVKPPHSRKAGAGGSGVGVLQAK